LSIFVVVFERVFFTFCFVLLKQTHTKETISFLVLFFFVVVDFERQNAKAKQKSEKQETLCFQKQTNKQNKQTNKQTKECCFGREGKMFLSFICLFVCLFLCVVKTKKSKQTVFLSLFFVLFLFCFCFGSLWLQVFSLLFFVCLCSFLFVFVVCFTQKAKRKKKIEQNQSEKEKSDEKRS
jgi:Flp pilus assembly protein TadB